MCLPLSRGLSKVALVAYIERAEARPVELQMHRRRIIRSVGDHFLQDGAQDTLLQRGGRMRMIPELFQVVAQSQQLLMLLGCEMWGQSAGFFHALL
jgi:hypothetical protein